MPKFKQFCSNNAQKPKTAGHIERKSNVVNLSHVSLNDSDTKVLEYGLNFPIAPSRIPLKELMCSIENAVTNLSEESADEARQECAMILRHAKLSKLNLSKEQEQHCLNLGITNKSRLLKLIRAIPQ